MDEKSCQSALVEALLKCYTLANQRGRDQCVTLLIEDVRAKVEREPEAQDDLRNIVRMCQSHPGGLASLEEAVRAREKSSVHMDEVHRCVEALDQALKNSGLASPIPATTDKPLDGACALVIGISKYEQLPYELPNGKKTHPFENLKFADEDAVAFHKFLTDSGCAAPEPLLNEQATRRAIMRSIDDLCRQSKVSDNPLVLIFFSGHGARDAEQRHYLVPHDGMRDDLFATALWSDTFKSAQRQLADNSRVIVFVDACHAGATGEPDAKGLLGCDPESLVDEGRYVVASCLAEQVSREADGHGVFSRELLQLLRFENDEDVGKEELELFDLLVALEQRVIKATDTRQKPCSNIVARTDIVLAVNHARRELRQSCEKKLLDAVFARLKATQTVGAFEIENCLERFIFKGKFDKGRDKLCAYFRDVALRLKGASALDEIHIISESLTDKWWGRVPQYHASDPLGVRGPGPSLTESKETTRPAPEAPESSAPSRPASAGDGFDPTVSPAIPGQVGAPWAQGERRPLSSAAVKGILEIIDPTLYGPEKWKLNKLLEKGEGASLKEYDNWCIGAHPTGDEGAWEAVLRDVGQRVRMAWDQWQKPQSPLSVRLTP